MKRRMTDKVDHADDTGTMSGGIGGRESAAGILGAVMLVLPVTGQAASIDPASVTKTIEETGVVQRFEDVRSRFLQHCTEIDCSGFDDMAGQLISQWANWSDWQNY